MLATLTLLVAPGFSIAPVHAGALAQLQLKSRVMKRLAHVDLCVGGARSAHCRAALDSALRGAAEMSGFKSVRQVPLGDADVEGARASLPVKFNTDPEWKKRAVLVAREGLTFVRMPRGGGRELTLGINRHGILGFSLKDSSGD